MSDPKIRVTLSEAREVAEAVAARGQPAEKELLRAIGRVLHLPMHDDVRLVLEGAKHYLENRTRRLHG